MSPPLSPFSTERPRAVLTSSTPPTPTRWAGISPPAGGGSHHPGGYRGDPRPLAPGEAGPFHRCHQVLRPDGAGALRRRQLPQAHPCRVEASLRRLQTDYIDLYQLHGYDPETPIDETLGALDDLVHQGKVRYVGCSNFLTYQLVRAIGRSETLHLARFDSVQPRYNLLFRQIEREMLPFCGEEGVGVIPYNPLAGGLLSGKHSRTAPPPEGPRFTLGNAAGAYQDRYWC